MEVDKIGVHQSHCCLLHGCKYGDEDCPVVMKEVIQDFPCEYCTDEHTQRMLYGIQHLESRVVSMVLARYDDEAFDLCKKEMKDKHGVEVKDNDELDVFIRIGSHVSAVAFCDKFPSAFEKGESS